MDNDPTNASLQQLGHTVFKREVAPGLDEKMAANKSSPHESQPEMELPASEFVADQKDLEKVEAETRTPKPVKIHRSKRRGLFGRFTIVAEVEEPKSYHRRTKWFITFVIALAAAAAPLGSSIIFRNDPNQTHSSFG